MKLAKLASVCSLYKNAVTPLTHQHIDGSGGAARRATDLTNVIQVGLIFRPHHCRVDLLVQCYVTHVQL